MSPLLFAMQDQSRESTESALVPEPLGQRAARVHVALRDAILDHRLHPGARLPEDEIGTIYGVSRTIVRSALQALAHERLVIIEANRGAHVARPSAEEARHVFDARLIIEPRVAALAATRSTRADTDRLLRHIDEESKVLAAGETSRAIALSAGFHLKIAAIAGQPILAGFVRDLLSQSSLIIALYWRRREATCEHHAHAALISAISARDSDRSAELMQIHIAELVSGLDLKPQTRGALTLAELLDPPTQHDHPA